MIELKVATGKKVKVSPHQASFHVKHASLKCPCFILVESNGDLLLYTGAQAAELMEKGIETIPMATFRGPKIDWQSLQDHLSIVEQ